MLFRSDGLNDYGGKPANGPFQARVRAGMGARLANIVGGNPYAFFSKQSGCSDHYQWGVSGLEAKTDGKVYVMGNTTFYGAEVIRQYDAAGNYLRTVFPPPAGKPVEDIKGWGVNVRDDGSFTLRNGNDWQSSWMGTTAIAANYGRLQAGLAPNPANDKLTVLMAGPRSMEIGTDGTLRNYEPQPFLGGAGLPPTGLRGPCYAALSPDRKQLYVSGLHSCQRKVSLGMIQSVDTKGFWRDGQVWRVDLSTRATAPFFALDESKVIGDLQARDATIGDKNYINPCSALHGIAVDRDGNVFICDRQNQRIVVLDKVGKVTREIPLANADALAVSPKSKALYVTTRYGDYGGQGQLTLLKFNDWSKDDAPAVTIQLTKGVARYPHESLLAVVEHEGQVLVWVAYTLLPVRIYRDSGAGLELVKDFYEAGPQRALDMQHMQVDPQTGSVYIDDAATWSFRLTDWQNPKFELLMDAETKDRLIAPNLALDPRNRLLYAHDLSTHGGAVRRYKLDSNPLIPAPAGDNNVITTRIIYGWGFSGVRPRGMAVCPDGALVTLGNVADRDGHKGDDYSGYIYYWRRDDVRAPWQPTFFDVLGNRPVSGGIRFDTHGNLYVGLNDHRVANIPEGYRQDRSYAAVMARIYKFAPTGSSAHDGLYPSAPSAPARVYDVHYSPMPRAYKTPRFGVDGWGRIYYPNGVESRVGVIDNEGNAVLAFGTWGNRDSMGGLEGDLVPTGDIPMACPTSVDATDDHIFVSDTNNVRLLRLAKTFAATETVGIK